MDRNRPKTPNSLVAELASELKPVQSMKVVHGIALVAIAAIVSLALVEMIYGLWRGMIDSRVSPFFFITNGMLAIVGAAAAVASVQMAKPQVGNSHEGARWSFAMIFLLPITGLIVAFTQGSAAAVMSDPYGIQCFIKGTAFSMITAAALTLWLRKGAPVSTNAAGLFAGVASGAVGSFVYGLSCPIDHAGHLGIWHFAPVLVGAVAGRIIIPRLIRW